MAFATAAAAGIAPTSPAPRTPKGVTGEGTSVCISSIVATSYADGAK